MVARRVYLVIMVLSILVGILFYGVLPSDNFSTNFLISFSLIPFLMFSGSVHGMIAHLLKPSYKAGMIVYPLIMGVIYVILCLIHLFVILPLVCPGCSILNQVSDKIETGQSITILYWTGWLSGIVAFRKLLIQISNFLKLFSARNLSHAPPNESIRKEFRFRQHPISKELIVMEIKQIFFAIIANDGAQDLCNVR